MAPPPVLTRAQLQAAVDDGKLSQPEMDAILEKQLADRIKKETRAEVAAENAAANLRSQIAAYRDADPALADPNSQKFLTVKAEFIRLRDQIGMPDDLRTELVAYQNTCGRRPGARGVDTTAQDRDAMEAGRGAGGGGGGTPPSGKDGPPADMPAAYVPQYQKWIKQGMFTGWNDPKIKAQIPFMKKAS